MARPVPNGPTPSRSEWYTPATRLYSLEVAETQRSISSWGDATFGPANALVAASRMNVEVTELLTDLGSVVQDPLLDQLLKANMQLGEALSSRCNELHQKGRVPQGQASQGKECPDILTVLYQVAEATGVDLLPATDAKMRINRKRKWERLASGRHQHS